MAQGKKDNDFSLVTDSLQEQHKLIDAIGGKIQKHNEKVSERCDEIDSVTNKVRKKKPDLNNR